MRYHRYFLVALALIGFCACGNNQAQNKITVWHWINDRQAVFEQLARQYKEKTGVDVEFRLFSPPDIYQQKIVAAAHAGNLPDIFGILGEKYVMVSFVNAGHVADLTQEMTKDNNTWKNSFYPQNIAIVSFVKNNHFNTREGIYGVPIDTNVMQFIYNKKLLKKSGLDPNTPPKTLDEMISMIDKVKKTDPAIHGFSCGWGENWLINTFAIEFAINQMGEEKLLDTITGKTHYTDDDWIKVIGIFETLQKTQALAPNIVTTINKEAEEDFALNKALFAFNGSWAVNVYKRLNPDLDYGFFTLPKINPNNTAKTWGGAGSSFMINARSAKKNIAVNFLHWLTESDQQMLLAENTMNLPSTNNIPIDKLPEKIRPLTNETKNLTHSYTWKANEDLRVLDVLSTTLRQVAIGAKTPHEAAEDIDREKRRYLNVN